jgi:hypothetical protein
MALTITVLAATQDMLRLNASTGGEGGDTAVLTQPQLIALCAAGALKSLLSAPLYEGPPGPGVAAWANMVEDGRLSIYATGTGTGIVSGSYNFTTDSGVNHFDLATNGAGNVVFELNFRHSVNR